MTQTEALNYWKTSALDSLQTAKDNFTLKHYDWTLFIGHLSLEKAIKGLIIAKTDQNPLPVHNLIKLCEQAKLQLTKDQTTNLAEINTFNIEARYDDYKLSFFKKATPEYTQKWLLIIEEIFSWIQTLY